MLDEIKKFLEKNIFNRKSENPMPIKKIEFIN